MLILTLINFETILIKMYLTGCPTDSSIMQGLRAVGSPNILQVRIAPIFIFTQPQIISIHNLLVVQIAIFTQPQILKSPNILQLRTAAIFIFTQPQIVKSHKISVHNLLDVQMSCILKDPQTKYFPSGRL